MRATPSLSRRLLAAALRAAVVGSLVAAGWGVYRGLPHEEEPPAPARRESGREAALRIRLRAPAGTREPVTAVKIPVQLYPIDMTAARNEYDSERRPGLRFEEFAARLMNGRRPVTAEMDERGETVVALPPGRWWVHVTLEGPREVAWRLPVTVTGRDKTVELTPDNAYLRAKRF